MLLNLSLGLCEAKPLPFRAANLHVRMTLGVTR